MTQRQFYFSRRKKTGKPKKTGAVETVGQML
jgi:hypothetical protein